MSDKPLISLKPKITVKNRDRPDRKGPLTKFYKDSGFKNKKTGDVFLKKFKINIKRKRGDYLTYRQIKDKINDKVAELRGIENMFRIWRWKGGERYEEYFNTRIIKNIDLIENVTEFEDNFRYLGSHEMTDELRIALRENNRDDAISEIRKLKIMDGFWLDHTLVVDTYVNPIIQLGSKKTDVFNLDKYVMNEVLYNIPYVNFGNNGQGNCIYDFVKHRYAKIKKIDKYFKPKDNTIGDIKKFCDDYKIPLRLFNLGGEIFYKNQYKTNSNSNYKRFAGIVSCHHFYPYLEDKKDIKIKLNESERLTRPMPKDADEDYQKTFYYTKNNKRYTRHGFQELHEMPEIDVSRFNKSMGLAKIDNFTYEHDIPHSLALTWCSDRIGNLRYEYDLKKAYWNVAFNIIEDDFKCPVFSALDIWKPWNGEAVDELSYYLISEQAMIDLKTYGFKDNHLSGKMFNFLLNNCLLKKDCIEYVKKPSAYRYWEDIRKCLKELSVEKDHYIFYNGLLGKTENQSHVVIGPLPDDECQLLTGWNYDNGRFHRHQSSKRYLNSCTIYNAIVEKTNEIIIHSILETGVHPVKIQVDGIGFDVEVSFKKYKELFKVLVSGFNTLENKQGLDVSDKQPYTKFKESYQSYHDGNRIIQKILSNYNANESIAYVGEGGSGKTTHILENHTYDYASSISNVNCANLSKDAITTYRLFSMGKPHEIEKRLKKLKGRTVWIDEFSMLGLTFWNCVAILIMYYDVRFIFSGDEEQLKPVDGRKVKIDDPIIKSLFNQTIDMTKETNHRQSGQILDISRSIRRGNFEAVDSIRRTDEPFKARRHICYFNNTRRYVNRQIMERNGYVFNLERQFVSKGVILKSNVTNKAIPLSRGQLFQVIDDTQISDLKTGQIVLDYREILKYLDVAFCITSHSSQGTTIKEPLVVWDVKRLLRQAEDGVLYTAVTRVDTYDNISISVKAIDEEIHEYNTFHNPQFLEDTKNYL